MIAFDAGFADQSHFTRVFRQAFGETPGHPSWACPPPRAYQRLAGAIWTASVSSSFLVCSAESVVRRTLPPKPRNFSATAVGSGARARA